MDNVDILMGSQSKMDTYLPFWPKLKFLLAVFMFCAAAASARAAVDQCLVGLLDPLHLGSEHQSPTPSSI